MRAELELAREREAATREILEIISQSRDDEQPVFETILKNACVLCNAPLACLILGTPDDEIQTLAAHKGMFASAVELFETGQMRMDPELSYAARSIIEGRLIAFDDMGKSELYEQGSPVVCSMVDESGIRSVLFVPLVKDGAGIGNITLFRREISPFDPSEIALVQTFAAQALIAIENVRRFREVTERLEREKASGDVLDIISRSRDDDLPVFRVITEAVSRLCRAPLAYICLLNVDRTHVTVPAQIGARREFAERLARFREPVEKDWLLAVKAPLERKVIRIDDLADNDLYRDGNEYRVNMVDEEGMRSVLVVPLVSGDTGVGCIFLYRREVAPFSDAEVALVQTFAAQAVIAIENVRQFREIRERLEREKATSDVLSVISQSRDDAQPVFKIIHKNITRLCDAPFSGLFLLDETGEGLDLVSLEGSNTDYILAEQTKWSISDPSAPCRAVAKKKVVHVSDLTKTAAFRDGHPPTVRAVEQEGVRTFLAVPLIRNDVAIGAIAIYPSGVRPFTDSQIELVKTFAAQAVIAIENARQFKALEESNAELTDVLERQTATANVLDVISQSPSDARPVFDVIAATAMRLCDAEAVVIWQIGADGFELAATLPDTPERVRMLKEYPPTVDEGSVAGQAFAARDTIHIDDLQADPVLSQLPLTRMTQTRTMLAVPLFSPTQERVGLIVLPRREVRAFSPEQIALVETFADQAAIAIENVRLFKALETLNAELGERVEEQVGEIERMGKLKRFLPAAVADTVVNSGSEDMLKSHRALLGVLFCDIRGFTAFCETAEPEETIEVLQTYHEEMGKLINAHSAGVDHRMGDGIMVLFNDPLPCEDPAGDAVRLAMAMRAKMSELCRSWKRMGHRLGFGVGVSLGYATVGMVGYEGRSEYTASGTAVNVAARLCDMAEDGEILLSTRAAIAVEDDFPSLSAGEVTLKGIREPVEVFRLVERAAG
ncbi:GAF domain-containing protein [Sulfitobacter sp. JBTF-M27]|uniref:GAF domain-containing protein n=1 Tax=Sulfitobacter sediminilitoris TaxID=2698830 RepID=A0A6P0CJ83_9RHOB|nr:GAF domain-containing protein [Sulfitobacter sediminilitoris]NEK25106.1 GAF domain-containing protein [Sulfitobacter sediminilitoris]